MVRSFKLVVPVLPLIEMFTLVGQYTLACRDLILPFPTLQGVSDSLKCVDQAPLRNPTTTQEQGIETMDRRGHVVPGAYQSAQEAKAAARKRLEARHWAF